jgi:hypothetical protein
MPHPLAPTMHVMRPGGIMTERSRATYWTGGCAPAGGRAASPIAARLAGARAAGPGAVPERVKS